MQNTLERLTGHLGSADGGAQLYVRHRQSVIADTAFGLAAPGRAMTPDTITLWMSAGKPLAAIAVMQLIDRNGLQLDTAVASLLPAFAVGGKSEITIRHLLTHTAGFRGPLNNFAAGDWPSLVARACALNIEPGWVPGDKAGYHVASSWFVLGEIVRVVSGQPFERYVRERVFGPVGAARSTVGLNDEEVAALGFEMADVLPDFPGNHGDAITVCRPGANARGPVRELAFVYESLLDHDGRLLKPATSRAMIARQRLGMFDHTFKQTVDWGFGLKLDSKRYGQVDQYGYGPYASDAAFGHSGNQVGCAFADPEYDLVVAWMTNVMPGEPAHQRRQDAVNAAIYRDLRLAGDGKH